MSLSLYTNDDKSLNKGRVEYIDVAKGIAIICVMVSHMWWGGLVHKILFSFEIPFFFFISGYFLSEKKTCKEIAWKRFRQLMLPLICMAVLIFIWRCYCLWVVDDWTLNSIVGCAKGIMKANSNPSISVGPLWFLPALWFVTIVVRSFLCSEYAFLFVCLVSVAGVLSRSVIEIPLSIQNGLACSVYFYLGYLCRKYNMLERAVFQDFFWILFLCAFWIYGVLNYHVGSSVPQSLQLAITAISAIPVFVKVAQLCSSLGGIKTVLSWVGRGSLIILCIHALDETTGLCTHMQGYIWGDQIRSLGNWFPYLRILLTISLYAVIEKGWNYIRLRVC